MFRLDENDPLTDIIAMLITMLIGGLLVFFIWVVAEIFSSV